MCSKPTALLAGHAYVNAPAGCMTQSEAVNFGLVPAALDGPVRPMAYRAAGPARELFSAQ